MANRYRFTQGARAVDIDVGTIHSAKGQTHMATLVIETFFKKHDMEDLLPWLLGTKSGAAKHEGVERLDRLRGTSLQNSPTGHLFSPSLNSRNVSASRLTYDRNGLSEWVEALNARRPVIYRCSSG